MKEVLDALMLDKAALAGNSLGGWMALKFATACPERVSRLILISSSGLAQVRPQFTAKIEQELQPDKTVSIDPALLGNESIPKEVMYFMNLILENFNPVKELPVFTDEDLQRLDMPILFLGGETDSIIDTQASAQRLSPFASVRIHLLPDCGHAYSTP
jgi:pimeloyl-ACP methyl ester carboxylesterase